MHSRLFHLKANPSQGLSILVVDDNSFNRTLLIPNIRKLFKKENIPISVIDQAEDGLGAVDKVKEKVDTDKKNYDIIFMDREMPKNIDGIEATHRIKDLETDYKLDDESKSLIIAWSASDVRIQYGDAELDKPIKCSQMENLFRTQGYLPSAPGLSV